MTYDTKYIDFLRIRIRERCEEGGFPFLPHDKKHIAHCQTALLVHFDLYPDSYLNVDCDNQYTSWIRFDSNH